MTNLYLDQRYADLLSVDLEGFKLKSSSPYRANCRCPLCGDSSKNRHKKRGWILQSSEGDGLVYYCHNCNASIPFSGLLNHVNEPLFHSYDDERKREYLEQMGRLRQLREPEKVIAQVTKSVRLDPKQMVKISSLPVTHPARKYIVTERKIPSKHHYRIFYCRDFNGWVNSVEPDRLPPRKESRIVLPIRDVDKKVVGVTGRLMKQDLTSSDLRYITIMFNESSPKTYGLDVVDFDKPYFITEGAFDSFFLPNCLAINGSAIDFGILENRHNAIFVLDNQPRDEGVVRTMNKVIDAGMRLVVWPNSPIEKEDLNGMFLAGRNPMDVVKDNVYKGIMAKNALNVWRRI